ncbi:hypothetical protein Peur_002745 [Populus x canadensis]
MFDTSKLFQGSNFLTRLWLCQRVIWFLSPFVLSHRFLCSVFKRSKKGQVSSVCKSCTLSSLLWIITPCKNLGTESCRTSGSYTKTLSFATSSI